MTKKNPYIFTIGFNSKDPNHIHVADLLNEQGKGNIASFLVRAILAYEGHTSSHVNPQIFEALIKGIIERQLAENVGTILPQSNVPTSVEALPMDITAQKNILSGLAGFRKK